MDHTSTAMTARRRGRPPRAANGYSETREALLQAGMAVLTEKGFSATGIDSILSKVGVPKGSFYHFFASKEAFGSVLIERYAVYFAKKLDQYLLDEKLAPLDRLKAFIHGAQQGMARYDYRRGCLVGNLGQEMGSLPESFREQLATVFKDWENRVAACFREACAKGDLALGTDCQRLASYFWIGWEGAVLRAKLEGSPQAIEFFSEFFFAGLPR